MNRRNLLGMAIGGVSLALAVDKVLAAEEHESTICDEKISSRMSGVEVVPGGVACTAALFVDPISRSQPAKPEPEVPR